MGTGEAALQRAHQLSELGRWAEALSLAQQAAADPSTAADALAVAARCLLALGRPRDAERAVTSALHQVPDSSYLHFLRGLILLNQKRRRPALRSAREAARLDPMSVQAQYLLVLCFLAFGAGYRGRARAAGRRALELGPTMPLAYEAAGRAEAASGRRHRAEAERLYRSGLALDPTDQDLALALGDVLRRSGRHREANDAYLAAAAIDPADSRTRNRLARLAGPGVLGLGAAGKGALVWNGGRLFGALHDHLATVLVVSCGLLVVGAGASTGVKLYRNRTLPAHVRRGLRGDYVNAVLSWLRVAAALLLVAAVTVAVDPKGSALPRAAALGFGAAGGLLLWASLHYRYGPPLRWADVRAALHPRRRRHNAS